MLSRFPKRWFTINGSQVLLTNVCRRVTIPQETLDNEGLYLPYRVRDGERPDMLSERLYGDPKYWWLICMVNKIFDLSKEWPMTGVELDKFIHDHYEQPFSTLHYIDPDGDIIDVRGFALDSGLTSEAVIAKYQLEAISGYQWEEAINDQRRNIKLIDPDYIQMFDEYLEKALYEPL